jgi:HD superfamily phosphohydrolase
MAREASPVRAKAATKSTKMQELFVPVHGLVKLHPEELAIVDHPSFQRLRRVRQLGFAHIVFPGGVHTRLEHSIGAVHVAQAIIEHVKTNFDESSESQIGNWQIAEIAPNVGRLIRLGALLHDIGHVPFGHTLEDELNHLRPHDGPARVEKIAKEKYEQYDLDKAVLSIAKPQGGWCLEGLIDTLYTKLIKELNINISPFRVLCLIICKPPKLKADLEIWQKDLNNLSAKIDLDVCRDVWLLPLLPVTQDLVWGR